MTSRLLLLLLSSASGLRNVLRNRYFQSSLSLVPDKPSRSSLGNPVDASSELNKVMSSLNEAQKYELVLQSYGTSILEESYRNQSSLNSMNTLFQEMIEKRVNPSRRSASILINAVASFRSCEQLGESMRLLVASGRLKVFGLSIGGLTTPALQTDAASFLEPVPSDDREQEVLYASLAGGMAVLWAVLEVASILSDEANQLSWAVVLSSVLAIGLNVYFRGGKEIRLAALGLERLTLKDSQRESHCDGAAFLVGYTLGLPCFCFRPDVVEALRLVRDSPWTLDVYKQPLAQPASTTGPSSQSILRTALNSVQGKRPSAGNTIPPLPPPQGNTALELIALGRILVWLMVRTLLKSTLAQYYHRPLWLLRYPSTVREFRVRVYAK